MIFLLLEILFHPRERIGLFLANLFVDGGSASMKNMNGVKTPTSPSVDVSKSAIHVLPAPFNSILLIVLGIGLILLPSATLPSAGMKHGHQKAGGMPPAFWVCVVSLQQPSGPQKLCPYSTSALQI
ncbi:MAG: hypothetical protein AAGG51_30215 [Cyanobacteria bacterium P01_G01_bin.54]